MLRGVPFFDECVFLHQASSSLIVTDLVQNHRGQVRQGFAKVVTKLMLEPMGFKDICIAPPLRFSFVIKDRPAFVESISAVQAWNFERIIVTHGDIIEDNASDTFKRQRGTGVCGSADSAIALGGGNRLLRQRLKRTPLPFVTPREKGAYGYDSIAPMQ